MPDAAPMRTRSPASLTAVAAATAIERGTLTCEALVRACVERIAEREPVVHAWQSLDVDRAIAYARELDHSPRRGLLHGIPVAVKDIIATADFPTTHGSSIYAGHAPVIDAACVSQLRAAGAVIPGKTVTTEFAYAHPGPTANPANPLHTPGGSSSGSAAAVADSMVPLGLGTQTAGSIIRPAAFCGVVGYKPTFGRLNLTGIKPFAPSLDTLGCFARDIGDIELMRCVLTGDDYRPLVAPTHALRVGVDRTPEWSQADASAQRVLLDVADTLRRHAVVDDVEALTDASLQDDQKMIMAYEGARSLAPEFRRHPRAISARLTDLIETGLRIGYREYVAAQQRAATARAALRDRLDAYDVLLTPAAPGEAPAGLDATGEPTFNRVWTLLGAPAVAIPAGAGERGLPVAVQLIGSPDADRRMLGIAQRIVALLHADR
jgi:Asp-tRNA(Asn)/Glu-tRNA(Gln) amidotransferase A subunit family amidase